MGKNSKAKEAEARRQYREARRREEEEKQRLTNRLMWQILIGVAAVILLVTGITIAVSNLYRKAPTMDELDFSSVKLEKCIDAESVTDYVRMNVTYTDANGYPKTGDIIVRLFSKVAPETVKNFQHLVETDFYDGLTFHRVYSGFMIQGGDPEGTGSGGSTPIKGEMTNNGFENNLLHKRGVLSMARLGGQYDSASCQFFIMHEDTASLDREYASFGYVVYGMDTVDGIAGTPVRANISGERTSPINPVIINYMTFVEVME